ARSRGSGAHGQPAGVQNRRPRQIPLRSFQAREGSQTRGREAEGDQVSGQHRRARLFDQDSPRRRISRPRQQSARASPISWSRNGAPGIRHAADAQSARRSLRHVSSGNGSEDHRSQYQHDSHAVAGEPAETPLRAATERRGESRFGQRQQIVSKPAYRSLCADQNYGFLPGGGPGGGGFGAGLPRCFRIPSIRALRLSASAFFLFSFRTFSVSAIAFAKSPFTSKI